MSPEDALQELALAVAARRKPFDPEVDARIGKACWEAIREQDREVYIAAHAKDYSPEQRFILELRYDTVAQFGALWRAGKLAPKGAVAPL